MKCRSFILTLIVFSNAYAQRTASDSIKPEYRKIYSQCLNANIPQALALLPASGKLSPKDDAFVTNFKARFAFDTDRSDYINNHHSAIDSLLLLFQQYWRKSLLDTATGYEEELTSSLRQFWGADKNTTLDSLGTLFKSYIASHHYFTTNGIGKTGKLFDLLIWKNQVDTVYRFAVNKEKIAVRVVLMKQFVTLGWEEYATLEEYYPGGWATDSALYCVIDAYDRNSESFLISYLAHEGRHFKDYKRFPHLKSEDLEYRAKLTELSMANKELYSLIQFFISNGIKDAENSHSAANYRVIHDLSKMLFHKEWEASMDEWKKIPVSTTNRAAYKIFRKNTRYLQKHPPV